MPTLQDVAERAGVSTATVSKVLSNTPYFSDATRIKVMDAVHELGYRPNLAARALSSGKTNIIAVVFPYIYDAIFKDPLVMRVLEGVESICTEQGYNILLSTPRLDANQPDDHFMRLVQSGYIEGLIAIDNVQAISFAQVAEELNIPAVILGHHNGQYRVQSDNFAGGKLLMEHVLSNGHRQIGIISVATAMNIAVQERINGIMNVAKHADLGCEIPIIESDFSVSGGAATTEQLLAAHPDLTVIIAMNDRMAIGAISALHAMNKRIPEDISVVGYDDIPMAATIQPPLTTINQHPVALGRAAADLLLKRLNGETPSDVVIRPALVQRQSLVAQR